VQRQSKKWGTLSAERIRRLEALGFVWNPLETFWEEMFTALVQYKEKHGDCNVPITWPENPQLGRWIANQRTSKKRGTLSEDRIRRLEAFGFVWSFR